MDVDSPAGQANVGRRCDRVGAQQACGAGDAWFSKERHGIHADAAGRSPSAGDTWLGRAGRNAIRVGRWSAVASIETLTAGIDQLIAYFNARKMDLPDGFFERKTQFVINGASFETLL